MIGVIVNIVRKKNSKGEFYKRVIFKLSDGKYVKTDIVSKYHNAKRWKPLLKIGKVIDGLRLISSEKVDADSLPVDYDIWRPKSVEEMAKAGMFG
jgi:hypothetical protein